MSTEAIISIIISLILGIPGLIVFFRLNRTRIVHFENKKVNLKDDLLKHFDELSIKYRGTEIRDNVYFFSGYLICQGKEDISKERSAIEVLTPPNSKLLDYKIVSQTEGLDFKTKVQNKKAKILFNLFKTGEYLEYESIIEINENGDLSKKDKKLTFLHRIPNIPKIKKIDFEDAKSSAKGLVVTIFLALLAFCVIYLVNLVEPLSLKIYDTETNTENNIFDTYKDHPNIRKIMKQAAEETSGLELLLKGKTKEYVAEYEAYKDGVETKGVLNIYFKKPNLWSDWVAFLIGFIAAIFAVLFLLATVSSFYYDKKYLNILNNK